MSLIIHLVCNEAMKDCQPEPVLTPMVSLFYSHHIVQLTFTSE